MNKMQINKVSKEKLLGELRRAHLMVALLALGVALLALTNSITSTAFGDFLTGSLVVLSVLIVITSLFVVYKISAK